MVELREKIHSVSEKASVFFERCENKVVDYENFKSNKKESFKSFFRTRNYKYGITTDTYIIIYIALTIITNIIIFGIPEIAYYINDIGALRGMETIYRLSIELQSVEIVLACYLIAELIVKDKIKIVHMVILLVTTVITFVIYSLAIEHKIVITRQSPMTAMMVGCIIGYIYHKINKYWQGKRWLQLVQYLIFTMAAIAMLYTRAEYSAMSIMMILTLVAFKDYLLAEWFVIALLNFKGSIIISTIAFALIYFHKKREKDGCILKGHCIALACYPAILSICYLIQLV